MAPRNPSNIESSTEAKIPGIVGNRYRVGRKIGEGSFGVIFEGTDLTRKQAIALKFENRKTTVPQLRDEYKVYKILANVSCIPSAYYFGQEGAYNVLVIDMLGPSLEDIFEKCHHKFSIKTVAMLAIQMVMRVQSVHEQGLIYRDIKPDNFLLGRPHSSKEGSVFMIDFGMAKYYINPKTNQHIPYKERKSLTGTARYMSINTHLGREQSRRDDLESLGHVLMYFLRGSLPWQGLKAANAKQKYTKIGEKKQVTSIKELCGGFPEEFAQYMNYVRTLGFDDNPDYKLLLGLFEKVLVKVGQPNDGIYDWVSRDNVISKESRSPTANTRCTEADAHRPLHQQEVIRVAQSHGAPNIEVKKSFWSKILNILACRACD